MGLFINRLKLNAAARSMHQFCPVVRGIFPQPPADEVVEATTVFLYTRVARDVFGPRFASRLSEHLLQDLKFTTPLDVQTRCARIGHALGYYEQAESDACTDHSDQETFTQHVRSCIRALLAEGGFGSDDAAIVKLLFPRFEEAVRRLRDHLLGIREQSKFVMK